MLNPILTLMIAGAFQATADDAFCPADLSAIAIQLSETIRLVPEEVDSVEEAPTVCDVRYYYDDFFRTAPPEAPLIVSYDWRSPIILDLP